MFNHLYSALEEKKLKPTLKNVFSVMDADVSIPNINQHLTLTYQADSELINKLNSVTRIFT